MKTFKLMVWVTVLSLGIVCAIGQETPREARVQLSATASAVDATGAPVLEAMLRSGAINGAPDTPVTNIRLVVKNVSPNFYSYIAGVVTFYDSSDVRCGESLFKADALAPGEAVETDAPGIRIKCGPTSWRIIATSLVPRTIPGSPVADSPTASSNNLTISVDGEEHPIQLNRPMVLTLGDVRRTIIVRQTP